MHQPDGTIAPSTSLHAPGAWKLAQLSQRWLPLGVGRYCIALGDIFAAAAGEAPSPVQRRAPPPAAVTNRKSRRETRLFARGCSCAILVSPSQVIAWDVCPG